MDRISANQILDLTRDCLHPRRTHASLIAVAVAVAEWVAAMQSRIGPALNLCHGKLSFINTLISPLYALRYGKIVKSREKGEAPRKNEVDLVEEKCQA